MFPTSRSQQGRLKRHRAGADPLTHPLLLRCITRAQQSLHRRHRFATAGGSRVASGLVSEPWAPPRLARQPERGEGLSARTPARANRRCGETRRSRARRKRTHARWPRGSDRRHRWFGRVVVRSRSTRSGFPAARPSSIVVLSCRPVIPAAAPCLARPAGPTSATSGVGGVLGVRSKQESKTARRL